MSIHLEPTPAQFKALAALQQHEGPVEMLNMLRFRDRAEYPAGSQFTPCSGREAYGRYGVAVLAHLQRAGAEIVRHAVPELIFIGPEGLHWDEMILVRYPSVAAFLTMITDPGYIEISAHRSAALADSRLIVTRPLA